MLVWRGHSLLLDAGLGQGLAQLLDLQLLVSEPALQLHRPPLKIQSGLTISTSLMRKHLHSGWVL